MELAPLEDMMGLADYSHSIPTTVVTIPADKINSQHDFHSVFQIAFGFFEGYGRNMDAWIDCMSCLDHPTGGMTNVIVEEGGLVAMRIDDAADFERRCPKEYRDLIECAAFVNHRRVSQGKPPLLALVLSGQF